MTPKEILRKIDQIEEKWISSNPFLKERFPQFDNLGGGGP